MSMSQKIHYENNLLLEEDTAQRGRENGQVRAVNLTGGRVGTRCVFEC